MSNKEVILKSVEFIENNLRNELSVLQIANEVHYSLYHFIRLFQSVTGYSPIMYLQHRRLSESIKDLKNTNKKIIEIALDYQFNSHEAFTRAFKKQFGVSPKQVREGISLSTKCVINSINGNYLKHSENVKNEPPEVIALPTKILTGISFFYSDDTEISDLSKEWGQFMQEVHNINNVIDPGRFYQVQYWSDEQDLGGFYFFIGVEVSEITQELPQFVVKIIPEGKYLKFIHKGLANQVGYTYKYIYNQFLPGTDYKLSKPFNFEYYGEKCLGPYNPESESDILIPID